MVTNTKSFRASHLDWVPDHPLLDPSFRAPVTKDVPHYHRVPKHPLRNVRFRRWLLRKARDNPRVQAQLRRMCKEDILFYINTFCFTHSPKDYPKSPDRPFITWQIQDHVLTRIASAIGSHDIAMPKSREMGATWMCVQAIEHRWHFYASQTFLMCSRKDELVDKTGSPKTLFHKIDYIHRHQPKWLLPTGRERGSDDPNRTKAHILNPDNNSVTDGEATVPDLGRGDRLTAIFNDEHGFMENASAISKATRDATNCRIVCSTPNGTGGVGAEFFRFVTNPNCETIYMHWTAHPEKARGLYSSENGRWIKHDPDYDWPEDFEPILDDKLRSPWYDLQCRRANSDMEIAQEIDIDFLGSGSRFFSIGVVEDHRKKHATAAYYRGMLFVGTADQVPTWSDNERGLMHVWCAIDPTNQKPHAGTFAVGCDIAAGTGGDHSSNSALQVINVETGQQVARYASTRISPKDFALFAIGVCHWFHGAKLIWEDNGPLGAQFRTEVVRLGYDNLYYRKADGLTFEKRSNKVGWWNPADGPGDLLGEVQRAMREGELRIQDEATIDELLQYVFSNGRVVHDGSLATDDESAKGKAHGDMAIALGVTWEAARGTQVVPAEPEPEEYPVGSHGYILMVDQRAKDLEQGLNEDWGFEDDPVDEFEEAFA